MGKEPLELRVGDWTLRIDIKDQWVQVCITSDKNEATYVRVSPDQARELRDYLDANLPLP